jgi:hypothetical protein
MHKASASDRPDGIVTGSWESATGICTIGLVYVGCFQDNPGADPTGLTGRVLNGAVTNSTTMTNNECVSSCGAKGYRYAGTQYGQWCFCGTDAGNTAPDDAACATPCAGDREQTCGGAWLNSVYLTHGSGGRTPTRLGYVGCFADNSGADPVGLTGRVLNGAMLPPPPAAPTGNPAMTNAMCKNYCQGQGFKFAGTQYGSFCFCGNSYEDRGISSNCSTQCAGDPDEVCGGPWANSVYRVNP